MDRIPFLDLSRLHATIFGELQKAFEQVVEDSSLVGADSCRDFELAFATAHGQQNGASCGSGTDALVLALKALGVGIGAEVIVPSMTFVATAEAVTHVGATPVVADVDPSSLLLTRESVESVMTRKTRAVIPVHLYGHPVPFDLLRSWREQGLIVIEDAAQAHLASWEGMSVGTAGDAACFSFYPGKNLGGLGDGGLVIAHDQQVTDRILRLRDHGSSSKYVHVEPGWSSRLDGMQAALLLVKLRHLQDWTDSRRRLADLYRGRLEDVVGIELVPWEDGAVHHLLVAQVPANHRDSIRASLQDVGIDTGVHYPIPLSLQPWLQNSVSRSPSSEKAADQVLSLPMDPLMTEDEVQQVCDQLILATPR